MPSRACALINLAPNYLPPVWVLTSPTIWTLSSLVLCCVVSAPQPQPRRCLVQRRQKLLAVKVPSACAATMFLLLMPSLPIKSATVNYCNYESELPAIAPPPPWLPPCRCAETLRELLCCFSGALSLLQWSPSRELDAEGYLVHMTAVTWERLHSSSWITGQAQPMATPPV